MDYSEKVNKYFDNNENLNHDVIEGLKSYIISLLSNILYQNIENFINNIVNENINWHKQNFSLINKDKLSVDQIVIYIETNVIIKRIDIGYNKFKSTIRNYQKDKIILIISPFIKHDFKSIFEIVSVDKVLNHYLLERFYNLKAEDFDELKFHKILKQLDIINEIRNHLSTSNIDRGVLFTLKNSYCKIAENKFYVWSNLFTPHDLIEKDYSFNYNFSHYKSIPLIHFCSDIIKSKKDLSIGKSVKKQDRGFGLNRLEKELLLWFKKEQPKRFNAVFNEIYEDKLNKFQKYIALTTLVALVDQIIVEICTEFNKKGFQVQIHDFNIKWTYKQLKCFYLSYKDLSYNNATRLFEILDVLYEENSYLRNSIVHLNGININHISSDFDRVYCLIQNIYCEIALFLKKESINLCLIPIKNINKLNSKELNIINSKTTAFNNYIINQ